MSETTSPAPERVGQLYDGFFGLSACALGSNLHFGYWPGGDGAPDPGSMNEASERMTDVVVERLRLRPGQHVLDLGCGVGHPAIRLARTMSVSVVGITVSHAQVMTATERAEEEHLTDQVSFRHADAMEMPFDDESFDAVMALESLPHMTDKETVFRQIARVLKPGGRLALTDFFERAPVPPDRRAVLDGYRAVSILAPFTPIGAYIHTLSSAGLRISEFIDVSDESVRATFLMLSELYERKRQLGGTTDDRYDPDALAEVTELGYMVAAARRPA